MSAESSPLYNHVIHNHLTISSYDGLLYISRTSKLNNVINVYKIQSSPLGKIVHQSELMRTRASDAHYWFLLYSISRSQKSGHRCGDRWGWGLRRGLAPSPERKTKKQLKTKKIGSTFCTAEHRRRITTEKRHSWAHIELNMSAEPPYFHRFLLVIIQTSNFFVTSLTTLTPTMTSHKVSAPDFIL